jgi:putative integral membrane protein mviN
MRSFFDAGVSLSLAQLFAYICLSGIAALVVCFGGACTRIAHVFEACPRLAKAVA